MQNKTSGVGHISVVGAFIVQAEGPLGRQGVWLPWHTLLHVLATISAICPLLSAPCYLPPVGCPLPPAGCSLPPASCHLPPAPAICPLPAASCHLPLAPCHLPPVPRSWSLRGWDCGSVYLSVAQAIAMSIFRSYGCLWNHSCDYFCGNVFICNSLSSVSCCGGSCGCLFSFLWLRLWMSLSFFLQLCLGLQPRLSVSVAMALLLNFLCLCSPDDGHFLISRSTFCLLYTSILSVFLCFSYIYIDNCMCLFLVERVQLSHDRF